VSVISREENVGFALALAPVERRIEGLLQAREQLRGRALRYGVSPFLVAVDLLAVVVAGALTVAPLQSVGVLAVATLVVYGLGGLYRSRLTLSLLDDLPVLVARGLAAGAIALAVDVARNGRAVHAGLLGTTAVFVVAAALARTVAYTVVRQVRRNGFVAHPTLVLGAGQIGGQLAETLLEHPEYGLLPVGFLDSDPLLGESQRPVPLLGGYDELARVIHEFSVREVIIAFSGQRESNMIDMLRTCDRLKCEIFFVPRLFEMHSAGGQGMDTVWGLPLVRMRRAAYRSASWRAKRLFDVVAAAVALTVAAPLMGLIALAVRSDSGRGVLFRQERVGVDGRRFQVYKFRTLRPVDDEESATRWSVVGDHRMGRVGRFLRRSSLDELPQLWNVLTGDMSLVGPRPERPFFAAEFARSLPRYVHRNRVPAGLTGYAQVHGLRGDTSIADRARFDNYYVENWSLWLDVKIILRTAMSAARGG